MKQYVVATPRIDEYPAIIAAAAFKPKIRGFLPTLLYSFDIKEETQNEKNMHLLRNVVFWRD